MNLTSTKLQKYIAEGATQNLDVFWSEIASIGMPFIEPLSEDESHSLVTFLWKGNNETHNVVLISDYENMWWWKNYEHNLLRNIKGTDIWFLSRKVNNAYKGEYYFSINHPLIHPTDDEIAAYSKTSWQKDPFNPKTINIFNPDGSIRIASILSLPNAPQESWTAPQIHVPSGEIEDHFIKSKILSIERRLWIYKPHNFDVDQQRASLLLLLDGWNYIKNIPCPTVVDNLIYSKRISIPLVALIDTRQNRFHDLTFSKPFVDYLSQEVVSWIQNKYAVGLTPQRTIIGGLSLGGLTAAYSALMYPHIFGKVLSQSGAFWPGLNSNEESVSTMYAEADAKDIQFYLEAGTEENSIDIPHISLLRSNRHFRDILIAKGYKFHYHEFCGSHQYTSWRQTFPEGLIYLLGEGR